ncbi:MAG: acyltransferase family protein, partial [Erysipelotrichaceae bacterium]|nr:acyltransferase family protein [Erysipelotrichaceae bacterium]
FGLCLLVSILIFIFVDGNNTMLYRGGMLLITLLFVVMLVMTIYPSFGIGRILEWKPLKYIGTISYEIYLWQYPVLFICNYLHFDYPIVQVFIVFVLAIALHVLLNVKKKVVANGILAVSLCVGSFGLVQAKDKKEDIESLKQEMEENTKKMEQDNQDKVSTSNLVFVGDSILLGCYDEIKEMYPDCVIDAVVSRHMGEEKTALQTIEANGQLKDTVIVCMGTNGVIYDFLAEELMSYLGDRTVYWVNNYCPTLSWQDSNNAYLNELAQKYSNLKIIDWYTVASSHPEYLSSDGIHPNEEGSKAYASLIQKEIEGK